VCRAIHGIGKNHTGKGDKITKKLILYITIFCDFNGILLVPVGYGKKESLQRVFVQDYFNPGNDIVQDLKIK